MPRSLFAFIVFLCISATQVFAAVQVEKIRSSGDITIDALQLRIEPPAGWHEIPADDDWHIVGAFSPELEPEMTDPLLVMYVMPILNEATLEAIVFSTAVKKASRLGEKALVTIGGREESEVAGQTALKYRYSHQVSHKKVIAEYTIFKRGELAFLISFWAPEDTDQKIYEDVKNFEKRGIHLLDSSNGIDPQLLAEMKEEDLKNAEMAKLNQPSGIPANLESLITKMQERLNANPDPRGYVALGIAYERMGKYKESESSYKKAIELDPKHPDGYAALGVFYGNAGDVLAAKDYFEKAYDLDPTNDELMNNLASAHILLKEYEKGIEYYQAALRVKPDDLMRKARLGQAYFLSGNTEEASRVFEEVLLKDPELKPVRHQLIQIYSQTGQEEKAKEHLTKFQENDS